MNLSPKKILISHNNMLKLSLYLAPFIPDWSCESPATGIKISLMGKVNKALLNKLKYLNHLLKIVCWSFSPEIKNKSRNHHISNEGNNE